MFLVFIFAIVLAGCGKRPDQGNSAGSSQNEPVLATGSNPEADILGVKIANEVNLIECLIKYTNQAGVDKYQIHDAEVKGNYVRGRFSYDNQLKPDIFWAIMSSGTWSLVYAGEQAPDCALLMGFPGELKSGCREDLNAKQISNFDECVKAGFLPSNDNPRRCFDGDNNVFVEVGASCVNKRYVSQEVSKCRDLDYNCLDEEKPFLDDIGCGCQKQ